MSINIIITLLQGNLDKQVSEVLPEVLKLASTTKQAKTSLQDEQGKTVAIFCYYHKQWEILADVPYGNKASSTTGYNTMCKCGVRHWTRQNNARKNIANLVLDELTNGSITVGQMAGRKAELLAELSQINPADKPVGYANLEDLTAELESQAKKAE